MSFGPTGGALCAYELFPGTFYQEPEYCDNEAEDHSDYCSDHDPDRQEPDWDSRRKDLLFDCE